MPPGHKLSCDPRRSPDMCPPDSIGKYILPKTAGNWAAIREDDGTQEYMSTEGSVLAVGSRSLFESAQLLGRDSRRAL